MKLVEHSGIEPDDGNLARIARYPIDVPHEEFGGPYRDRTDDLLLARQALSHLS